jgi:hypothetical protein
VQNEWGEKVGKEENAVWSGELGILFLDFNIVFLMSKTFFCFFFLSLVNEG